MYLPRAGFYFGTVIFGEFIFGQERACNRAESAP